MKSKVILLAQGEAKRLSGLLDRPKHFLEVAGEPIIERTVWMLRSFGIKDITVVAHDIPIWRNWCKARMVRHFTMDAIEPTCALSMLRMRPLWSPDEETVFLFGDVIFSRATLFRCLKRLHVLSVVGRKGNLNIFTRKKFSEVFAVKIDPSCHSLIDTMELNFKEAGRFVIDCMILQENVSPSEWVEIDDWTDDIDSPDDLRNIPLLERLIQEEEVAMRKVS